MKSLAEKAFIRFSSFLCRVLPVGAALALGRGTGLLGFYLVRQRRRTALRNLLTAYGKTKSPGERRAIAKESFKHLGMNLVEFLRYHHLDEKGLEGMVVFEGEEYLRRALGDGRGVLMLSAHLGNWELSSLALARRGYPLAVISKIPGNREVGKFWIGSREKSGIKVLRGRGLLVEGMRHLADGGTLGFVLDQNARRSEGVFVPFFGREACTLKSLALIARRTGAPVVPAFTFRCGRQHRTVFEKPFDLDATGDVEGDVLRWTREYTAWTEKVIRLHPEQWTWLHDRWKTERKQPPASNAQRPAGETGRRG